MRNIIRNILSESNIPKYLYHATYEDNVKSILKNGLVPDMGEHSEDNEDIGDAIWFFNNKNSAIDYAISDVFNDRSVAILRIDVSGIKLEQEGRVIFYTKEKYRMRELM